MKYEDSNWGMTRKQTLYLSQNAMLLLFSANRKLMNISWDTCIEKICFEGIVKLQAGMLYYSYFLHKGIPNYDTFEFATCNAKQLPFPCLRLKRYRLTRSSHFFKSYFASQLILNPWLKLFTRAYRIFIW